MKEIKDYLHLYLGCEVLVTDLDGQSFRDKVESVIDDKAGKRFSIYEWGDVDYENNGEQYQYIHLLLRPLSDMTEEEQFEMTDITGLFIGGHFVKALQEGTKYVIDVHNSFEVTKYLLSKHFDLFGLIEAGLAIDKTTLK